MKKISLDNLTRFGSKLLDAASEESDNRVIITPLFNTDDFSYRTVKILNNEVQLPVKVTVLEGGNDVIKPVYINVCTPNGRIEKVFAAKGKYGSNKDEDYESTVFLYKCSISVMNRFSDEYNYGLGVGFPSGKNLSDFIQNSLGGSMIKNLKGFLPLRFEGAPDVTFTDVELNPEELGEIYIENGKYVLEEGLEFDLSFSQVGSDGETPVNIDPANLCVRMVAAGTQTPSNLSTTNKNVVAEVVNDIRITDEGKLKVDNTVLNFTYDQEVDIILTSKLYMGTDITDIPASKKLILHCIVRGVAYGSSGLSYTELHTPGDTHYSDRDEYDVAANLSTSNHVRMFRNNETVSFSMSLGPNPTLGRKSTKLNGGTLEIYCSGFYFYAYATRVDETHYTFDLSVSSYTLSSSGNSNGSYNIYIAYKKRNGTYRVGTSSLLWERCKIYDTSPCSFIIDQRGEVTDPDDMVTSRFYVNGNGTRTASVADADLFAYLRKNTHRYLGRSFINDEGQARIYLRKLNDINSEKFTVGSTDSTLPYLLNQAADQDVWTALCYDVYYRCDPDIPEGETEPNEDYIRVTFALEIPEGQDDGRWNKWDKNTLVGTYKGSLHNNELRSTPDVTPKTFITRDDFLSAAQARGEGFELISYDVHKFIALLFYGYYGTLNSQETCGYGSNHYDKKTGITTAMGMTDTDLTNGGDGNTSTTAAKKSVNFWGLEDIWSGIAEFAMDRSMWASKPENKDAHSLRYVEDFINENGSIIVTDVNGEDKLYETAEAFTEDYPDNAHVFFVAYSPGYPNNARFISTGFLSNTDSSGCVSKMRFNKHVDLVAKEMVAGYTYNTHYCDFGDVPRLPTGYYFDTVAFCSVPNVQSVCSVRETNGVGTIRVTFEGNKGELFGSRLVFRGTDDTVITNSWITYIPLSTSTESEEE